MINAGEIYIRTAQPSTDLSGNTQRLSSSFWRKTSYPTCSASGSTHKYEERGPCCFGIRKFQNAKKAGRKPNRIGFKISALFSLGSELAAGSSVYTETAPELPAPRGAMWGRREALWDVSERYSCLASYTVTVRGAIQKFGTKSRSVKRNGKAVTLAQLSKTGISMCCYDKGRRFVNFWS